MRSSTKCPVVRIRVGKDGRLAVVSHGKDEEKSIPADAAPHGCWQEDYAFLVRYLEQLQHLQE